MSKKTTKRFSKLLEKVDATKSMSEVFEDVKNIIDEKLEELLWKW